MNLVGTLDRLVDALVACGGVATWRRDTSKWARKEYPDMPEVIGVHVELPNGCTLSVAWGPGTYSNLAPDRHWDPEDGPTYEALAWGSDGEYIFTELNPYDPMNRASVWELAVYAKLVLDRK